MKTCEYFEAQIDLLLDGMLTPSEEAEVREHLRVCPACAARERELREMKDAFAALEEAPPELHERIMAAVAAEPDYARRMEKKPLWKRLPSRRVLSGVAACAVLALGVILWQNGAGKSETAYMTSSDCAGTPEAYSVTADAAAPEEPAASPGPAAAKAADNSVQAGTAEPPADSAEAAAETGYAFTRTFAGDRESLRSALGDVACVELSEYEDRWELIFETGSESETAFLARLSELGFTEGDSTASEGSASPYTRYLVTDN